MTNGGGEVLCITSTRDLFYNNTTVTHSSEVFSKGTEAEHLTTREFESAELSLDVHHRGSQTSTGALK